MMKKTTIVWSTLICAGLALGACGTVDGDSTDESGATPGSTSNASDTGITPPGDTDNPPPGDSGQMTDDDGGSTEAGCNFLCPTDGGDPEFECDMFAQDCMPGDKCMPWANDGGNAWNATRCSPIADNPGQPGDQCSVEGSGVSGIDDCDILSMCWDVDPKTNLGTCVAMCAGDADTPICEDPDTACNILNEGALVLCLPTCDPLLQDCDDGQACYPVLQNFTCAPDASGPLGLFGDPCEFVNVCDPGLFCADAAVVPNCTGSVGCCNDFCDIDDPGGDSQCTGAAAGQMCVPWDPPPGPGLESVGACLLPT